MLVKFDKLTEVSSIGEKVYDFKDVSPPMEPKCMLEKVPEPLGSYEPFCLGDDCSSDCDVSTESLQNGVLVDTFDSISINDSSRQCENEGKNDVVTGDASESRCQDSLYLFRRSTGTRKSNQNTENKKLEKRCRQSANKKLSLDMVLLKVTRKKRSYFCKPASSSAWRSLGAISRVPKQNPARDVNLNENCKPQKKANGRGMGKQDKTSLQKSKGKNCASAGRIRLKIKLGKGVGESRPMDVVPVVDNIPGEYCRTPTDNSEITKYFEGKLEEELPRKMELKSSYNDTEKVYLFSDASAPASDLFAEDKECSERLAAKAVDNDNGFSSQEVVGGLAVNVDNGCLDPGTSPDSEVINLTPDAQNSGVTPEDLDGVLVSSKVFVASGDITIPQTSSKKGKKKDKHDSVECRFLNREITSNASVSEKCGKRGITGDKSYSKEKEASVPTRTKNFNVNTPSNESFVSEPLLPRVNSGDTFEPLKVETGTNVDPYSRTCSGLESSEAQISKKLPPNSKGRKQPKSSRSKGVSKARSEAPDSTSKREKTRKKKGNQGKSVSKIKGKKNNNHVACDLDGHPKTGSHTFDDSGDTKIENASAKLDMVPVGVEEHPMAQEDGWVCCDDCYKWRRIPSKLADLIDDTCRWTCQDNMDKDFADCSIPQEKSNSEINAELGIQYASGEEDAYDAPLNSNKLENKQLTVPLQSSWRLIKSNLFLHRSRKRQTIDEIMVCHCKPRSNGRMGCGGGCLNRMLNIECVQGTCPSGELCSNQQFQRRNYAKMKWFRSGKKGYGLQLLEDISKGQFLIEYVGEVLDLHAYEARQREYALQGHKHFYFMTLNGSEVIDACAKGNLGRFINHSCDPNCRTEKWMVNGEVCIGLFALRDIRKGEEVTFDYNYVRVFGAAAKKCVCGSSQCRGYIGGDPLNAEVIVQDDSDDEYPEPIMVCENGEMDESLRSVISAVNSCDVTEIQISATEATTEDAIEVPSETIKRLEAAEISLKEDEVCNYTTAVGGLGTALENTESMETPTSAGGLLSSSIQSPEAYLPPDDAAMSKAKSVALQDGTAAEKRDSVQRHEISSTKMSIGLVAGTADNKKKSKPGEEVDRRAFSKCRPLVKSQRSSGSVKKGKSKSDATNATKSTEVDRKLPALLYKSKKPLEGSLNGRFEAVEIKLNELLDSEGGISKRRDATRGYLKLLLLTAASSDSGNGEAIQSNRDLSMILDALLKTKSRTVLVDVVNKNGLQMLHNIMKRYRKEFNKIPILRKLLKVLAYLAEREILKLEHIIGGPPRPGVESFKESILTLTEHDDKEVHRTAREFRDRWIPRHLRRNICIDRENGRMEFHWSSNTNRFSQNHRSDQIGRSMDALDSVKQTGTPLCAGKPEDSSASCNGGVTSETKSRKRKSRWDQPAEPNTQFRLLAHKEPRIQSRLVENSYSGPQCETGDVILNQGNGRIRMDKSCHAGAHNFNQQTETKPADEGMQDIDEDFPPGFSTPLNSPLVSSSDHGQKNVSCSKCPCEVATGHPQERFISRLPISYGIPFSFVQQLGSPQPGTVDSWAVAPGMPFHPFPPLPSYPCDRRHPPNSASNHMKMCQSAEKDELDAHNYANCSDQNPPSTSGSSPVNVETPGVNNQQNLVQARDSSYSLGRRYFKQQKWNNSKFPPPWIRDRNDRGFMEKHSRNGMHNTGVEGGANDVRNRVEASGSTFYQHSQHRY